jgi:hypothetical protein
MTCQSIPGGTPTPGTTVTPVVTQRVVEVEFVPVPGNTVAQSPCNPDEVVTGGGFDVSEVGGTTGSNAGLVIEEFAVNNAWHVRTSNVDVPGGMLRVFAECLKLVPS